MVLITRGWVSGDGRYCRSLMTRHRKSYMPYLSRRKARSITLMPCLGYITRHGLPQAIYCDRHSVFFASATSDGRVPLTAFGRALASLDIEHIPSSCPQGRGRVERAHRTAQDSLLKEMANQIDLIGKDEAAAMTATNAFLPGWIAQRNTAFAVPAGHSEDAHRPCPYEHEAMRLILSVTDERKPCKNKPFSYNGQLYQETFT